MPRKLQVLKCAATSRLIILSLQVLFNALIEDHDARVFVKPGTADRVPSNDVERLLHFLLEGLERWDAQYFLHVAEHGYVYEKTLAFFPLFPLLTKVVASTVLFPLHLVANEHLVLLTAATIVNQACFCASAILIYSLGRRLLSSPAGGNASSVVEHRAFKAAVLFCYNPASIFFSAAYSESAFSALTFVGMFLLEFEMTVSATAAFALSALVRSNGIVNAGFLLYAGAVRPLFQYERHQRSVAIIAAGLTYGLTQTLIVFASFALFQLYAYETFCVWPGQPDKLSAEVVALHIRDPSEYVLPGSSAAVSAAWCTSRLPVSYAYVQNRYWNVGFIRYFEYRQIPNFVLAAPAVFVCLNGIFRYAIRLLKAFSASAAARQDRPSAEQWRHHLRVLPYIVHCSFLLVFGITSMHVQIITRMLVSSTPFFCLFAAAALPDLADSKNGSGQRQQRKKLLMSPSMSSSRQPLDVRGLIEDYVPLMLYWSRRKQMKTRNKMVLVYFVLYFVGGTALFSNFLPWT